MYWLPYSSHTSHHPSQIPWLPCISYATQKLMLDSCKMVEKQSEIPYISVVFFPSLKQNFIAYRSSKVQIAFLEFTSGDNQALVGYIPIAAVAVDFKCLYKKVWRLIECKVEIDIYKRKESDEMVDYIISEYCNLEQREYRTKHDSVGKLYPLEIREEYKIWLYSHTVYIKTRICGRIWWLVVCWWFMTCQPLWDI